MYEFVDRPLHRQVPAVRLMVWAIRQWLAAARDGRCVCRRIACAFTTARVPSAAGPLLATMRLLVGNARTSLRLGALDASEITEHEAVLLSALVAASCGREGDCRAVARLLVHADMEPALTVALIRLAQAFDKADMRLVPIGPGTARQD